MVHGQEPYDPHNEFLSLLMCTQMELKEIEEKRREETLLESTCKTFGLSEEQDVVPRKVQELQLERKAAVRSPSTPCLNEIQ